jgi:hypothetical protein
MSVSQDDDFERPAHIPDDVPDEIIKGHAEGSGSMWSDPDAMSSDLSQAVAPGYEEETVAEEEAGVAEEETAGEEETGETVEHTESDPGPLTHYDPADYSVAEVMTFVTANPDLLDSVLDDELDGKARTTLIDQLTAMKG